MSSKRRSMTLAALAAVAACSDTGPTAPEVEGLHALASESAGAHQRTEFTATDVPVVLIAPGTMVQAGARYVIRGVTVQARFEATDPRMTGLATVSANGVLDVADASGPVWGTLTLAPDGGGLWSGTWQGQRVPSDGVWIAEVRWHLEGSDGPVRGLHARGEEIITSFTPVPSAYLGQLSGVIR